MAFTSHGLNEAGFLSGLADHLRDVAAEIVAENPTISAWTASPDGPKVYPASIASGLSGVSEPYCTVSVTSINPEQKPGGVSDLIGLAYSYFFFVSRKKLEPGDVSVGGLVDEHIWWMRYGNDCQNERLFRAGQDPYIEKLERWESVFAEDSLTEERPAGKKRPDRMRVRLEINVIYRARSGARENFRTLQENP